MKNLFIWKIHYVFYEKDNNLDNNYLRYAKKEK